MRPFLWFQIACIAITFSMSVHAQNVEKWTVYGNLSKDHVHGSIIKIGQEEAYYVGGYSGGLFSKPSRVVHRFYGNAANHGILEAPSMPEGLAEMPVINLSDTAFVVVGGYNEQMGVSPSVYMYSIAKQAWKKLGNLSYGRRQHAAYLLSPTEIVVAGGRVADQSTISTAEIFDMKTGNAQLIPAFPVPINGSTFGLMSDGRGIIAGGREGGGNSKRISSIYSFNRASWSWVKVNDMASGRETPMGLRLGDGRMVIVGGSLAESPLTFTGACYLEKNRAMVQSAEIPLGLVYAGLTERSTGRVLVVGGLTDADTSTNLCYYWDVNSGLVTPAPSLNYSRRYLRAVTLGSGGPESQVTFAVSGIHNNDASPVVEVLKSGCDPNIWKYDLSKMNLVGDARSSAPSITLTPAATFRAGAAWMPAKLNVANGFDIRFSFRMRNGNDNGYYDNGPEGADGVTMVLQNVVAAGVGNSGKGIGYTGLVGGLAIEFDSYCNADLNDPSTSHIAVQVSNGITLSSAHEAPYLRGIESEKIPEFKASGTIYFARVVLRGKQLQVFCDTTGVLSTPALTVNDLYIRDVVRLDKDETAFLGFTSATGYSTETHELLDLHIGSCDQLVSGVDDQTTTIETLTARVIPTPSRYNAFIELSHPVQSSIACHIIDISGLEVATFTIPAGQTIMPIDVSLLPSGWYRVQATTQSATFVVPLMVVK